MRPELIMIDEKVDGGTVTVDVVLILEDAEYRGSASGPADDSHRAPVVCEAALTAAQEATDRDIDLIFSNVSLTTVSDENVALAMVRVANTAQVYVGTAQVRGDGEVKAVARALMDAVNRPLFG